MLLKISSSTSHATVIIFVTGTILLEIYVTVVRDVMPLGRVQMFSSCPRDVPTRIKLRPYSKTTVEVGFYEI